MRAKASSDPSSARRRAIASLGATTLHARRPDAAKRYGAKGGRSTAYGYLDGPSAWGKRMALARWGRVPFAYRRSPGGREDRPPAAFRSGSRAPNAGPGGKGDGTPEPGPAAAGKCGRSARAAKRAQPQQLKLL
jgi:hypothetical protein